MHVIKKFIIQLIKLDNKKKKFTVWHLKKKHVIILKIKINKVKRKNTQKQF